jgi:hypothetical protein
LLPRQTIPRQRLNAEAKRHTLDAVIHQERTRGRQLSPGPSVPRPGHTTLPHTVPKARNSNSRHEKRLRHKATKIRGKLAPRNTNRAGPYFRRRGQRICIHNIRSRPNNVHRGILGLIHNTRQNRIHTPRRQGRHTNRQTATPSHNNKPPTLHSNTARHTPDKPIQRNMEKAPTSRQDTRHRSPMPSTHPPPRQAIRARAPASNLLNLPSTRASRVRVPAGGPPLQRLLAHSSWQCRDAELAALR